MFCRNCGAEISEKAYVCPKCGVKASDNNREFDVVDEPNAGFAVLGFFIPLIGLILYLVWKDKTPLKARSCGKGALIGVIVSVVFYIFYAIIIGATIGSALYY